MDKVDIVFKNYSRLSNIHSRTQGRCFGPFGNLPLKFVNFGPGLGVKNFEIEAQMSNEKNLRLIF